MFKKILFLLAFLTVASFSTDTQAYKVMPDEIWMNILHRGGLKLIRVPGVCWQWERCRSEFILTLTDAEYKAWVSSKKYPEQIKNDQAGWTKKSAWVRMLYLSEAKPPYTETMFDDIMTTFPHLNILAGKETPFIQFSTNKLEEVKAIESAKKAQDKIVFPMDIVKYWDCLTVLDFDMGQFHPGFLELLSKPVHMQILKLSGLPKSFNLFTASPSIESQLFNLTKLTKLRKVSLDPVMLLARIDGYKARFLKSLMNIPNLEEIHSKGVDKLDFSDWQVSKRQARLIASIGKSNQPTGTAGLKKIELNLNRVQFEKNDNSEEDFESLNVILQGVQPKILKLSRSHYPNATIDSVAMMTQLESLSLAQCMDIKKEPNYPRIKSESLEKLSNLKNLSKLDLSHNELRSAGVSKICQQFTNLTVLRLRGNVGIDNSAATYIWERLSNLIVLDLSFTKVGDPSYEFFNIIRSKNSMNDLKKLSLTKAYFNRTQQVELKAILSHPTPMSSKIERKDYSKETDQEKGSSSSQRLSHSFDPNVKLKKKKLHDLVIHFAS